MSILVLVLDEPIDRNGPVNRTVCKKKKKKKNTLKNNKTKNKRDYERKIHSIP